MRSILTYIKTRLQAINLKRAALYEKTILSLELIYLRTNKRGKPTFKDSIAISSKIVLVHVLFPEFYFLLFGITLLVFANGAFANPEVDYGKIRPVIFVSTSLLAGLVPLAVSYITSPFHLLYGANLWLLTGIHVVLTAIVFSFTQPLFEGLFINEGIASFEKLIFPVLMYYSLAEFYLLSRLNNTLSFQKYKARHSQPTIDHSIPAHISGPLISMSSQDHYVEIVTENGRHLERMTMKKAVELVPESAGLRVHRSHWVAYNSILSIEKSSERHFVLLRNGAKIPVGKSKLSEVQNHIKMP